MCCVAAAPVANFADLRQINQQMLEPNFADEARDANEQYVLPARARRTESGSTRVFAPNSTTGR